jgi:phospholipid/cholesterol/gamma-HCH transport system substrate-binding protein
MMINDPSYAEEIRMAIRNINKLLGKATEIRLLVDIGGDKINGYTSGRAGFKLQIFPTRDRYYLIGVSIDPRGKRSVKETTVTSGGVSTTTTTTETEEGGLLINLMFGKIFKSRLEAAVGVLNGDGAVTGALRLGPTDREDILQLRADVYNRGKGYGLDSRYTVLMRPFSEASILSNIYLRGGIESIHKVSGALPYFGGAGVVFDDNDIKLLFAFK